MINEIELLRGKDYILPCGIAIHHPTVGEILDWDEERYDQFIFNFTAVPTDYRVPLYDAGIDCDEMSDYELFLMLYRTFTREQSQLLFGDLDFTCFQLAKRNDSGSICIADPVSGLIIDEVDYLAAVEFARAINGLKRSSMKAGNAATKAFLIEDERIAMRFRKKKKFESILFPLISSMVNSPGFKYDYQECMDLPIFTFYESVSRIQKIMSHNALITGIYSGCVDSKKITNEQLNWMGRK